MVELRKSPEPTAASAAAPEGPGVYHCGPLRYSLRGLVILFAWLLWGDFCFQLMETVTPAIMPLKLKSLSASNTSISIIMTVLPGIMNMTICPWVSSASDRYRSRWGRRIPFILWTMPFLVASLIGLGFSDVFHLQFQTSRVAEWLHVHPLTATLTTIGFFMTAFAFFNMFVGSVFWYLFNDVVPPQFLGRFMGLFRIVSAGATALYNYFLYDYGFTHMRPVLTGAALLYLFGFGLMCLMVREGEYPPPPQDDTRLGVVPAVKTFARQSFSAKFYWYFYLMQTFSVASNAYLMFYVFFQQEMGLTLNQVGKLNAFNWLAGLAATWLTAVYVDRWHPLRIRMYLSVFGAVTGFGGWIWLGMTLPGSVFFWVSLGGVLVTRFAITLGEGAEIPLFMRLMPKSLYGQFSSANAMVRTFGGILAALLFGVCMDWTMRYYGGSDFAYRWLFVWPWLFGIGSTVFVCLGYREWRRLGGDDGFRPPAPWTAEGFEEVADKVKSTPARPDIVMTAIWLGVVAMLVNVVLVLVFMYFMHHYELNRSLHWYAWVFIPVKLALTAAAYWQLVHIRRDIAAQARGEQTRYGVPHHGVMMVNAIQGLIYFPIFWYQTIEMIHLGLDYELILFGVANLMTTAGTILGVHLVRWIERPVSLAAAPGAPEAPAAPAEARLGAGVSAG